MSDRSDSSTTITPLLRPDAVKQLVTYMGRAGRVLGKRNGAFWQYQGRRVGSALRLDAEQIIIGDRQIRHNG